ncbi:hypothetical protein ACE1SV_34970 [Streptomyces sp. E-15]
MPTGDPVPYRGLELVLTRFVVALAALPAIAITRPDGRYTAGAPFENRHRNRWGRH